MEATSPSPFGQFYVLYKIHKGMKNGRWPTRPVCSDVSSIPHGLGKWVTEQLLPIAHAQDSFFRDSFDLKNLLENLHLPPNALLFTSNATAMYTNIKTAPALDTISQYLREHEQTLFHHYQSESLISALHIVFLNKILKFGDTYWRQISGTGMGISPAPHGRQSSMPYMSGRLSLAGHSSTCSFINGSLTTSSEFGSVTLHPNGMASFGSSSPRKCNNGMP
jgi:hypothetical protein